jgi:hypothetical protein
MKNPLTAAEDSEDPNLEEAAIMFSPLSSFGFFFYLIVNM